MPPAGPESTLTEVRRYPRVRLFEADHPFLSHPTSSQMPTAAVVPIQPPDNKANPQQCDVFMQDLEVSAAAHQVNKLDMREVLPSDGAHTSDLPQMVSIHKQVDDQSQQQVDVNKSPGLARPQRTLPRG